MNLVFGAAFWGSSFLFARHRYYMPFAVFLWGVFKKKDGCMTKHRATRHLGPWPQYQVALYRLFKVVLSVSAFGNLLLIVCYVFFMFSAMLFFHVLRSCVFHAITNLILSLYISYLSCFRFTLFPWQPLPIWQLLTERNLDSHPGFPLLGLMIHPVITTEYSSWSFVQPFTIKSPKWCVS